MALGPLGDAVRLLRQLDDASQTDRELLEAVAAGDRVTAFGRLIERHGAMVYGVCKRVLRNAADADDAFQATFLVLAKQASARGWRDSVANYLYGVAYRTAIRARGRTARRKYHEDRASAASRSTPDDRVSVEELRAAVDDELNRLPEKFRLPVLLCCLHDCTIEEAATQLRLPATTVKGRLQQGRDALRERLTARGFGLGAGLLATLTTGGTATAVPLTLHTATVQLAVTGSATVAVTALTNEEFAMLFWKKMKTFAVTLGVFAAVGAGVLAMTKPTAAALVPQADLPAENRVKAPAPAEAEKPPLLVSIASPKVNNIQDLRLSGANAKLDVVVTNVSDKPVKLWRDWCSWGYFNISLEFSDENAAGAKSWIVSKAPRDWSKNFPDAAEIASGGSIIFTVPLTADTWEGIFPNDGKKLKMRVLYKNEPDKFAMEKGVWTGQLLSSFQEYIVRK